MSRRPRLDPSIFHLPVEKMRDGYYSDKYFVRSREILLADGHRPHVTMQVFGKHAGFLGGIDEAIAILKLCAADWDELVVHALYDGDEIAPWETVLLIEGPYDAFAHLETLYLGLLFYVASVMMKGCGSRPQTKTPPLIRPTSVPVRIMASATAGAESSCA